VSERLEYEIDLSPREELTARASTVDGLQVLSLGGLLELVLAAAEPDDGRVAVLENVEFCEPVSLNGRPSIVLDVTPDSGLFQLRSARSAIEGATSAMLHMTGFVNATVGPSMVGASHRDCDPHTTYSGEFFYAALAEIGWIPGAQLRLCERVAVEAGCDRASLALGDGALPNHLAVPPAAILDAALQLLAFLGTRDTSQATCVRRIGRIRAGASIDSPSVICAERRSDAGGEAVWSAYALDQRGERTVELLDVRLERVAEQRTRRLLRWTDAVVQVARALLVNPELGPADDLIAAGASSMDIVRLASALAEAYGWAPPLEVVFENPNPESIARTCVAREASATGQGIAQARLLPDQFDVSGAHLARAERRLWYLERFADVSPTYNESVAWLLEGELDTAALQRSFAAVVARHESLRTVFPERDGEPYREVRADIQVDFSIVDASGIIDDAALQAALADEARRPFKPSAPLFRVVLMRIAEERHALLLIAHHMVCDAWSVARIVQAEIQTIYAGLRLAGALPEMRRPPQVSHYAAWEARHLDEHADALIAWWRQELGDAPTVLQLPCDHPRPARLSHRGARLSFKLDPELRVKLAAFAHTYAVSPFAVLFAAYRVLIFRYASTEKALIAVPASVRRAPASEQIVGCLVNTIPVRVDVNTAMTLQGVVQAVKLALGRALGRAEVPFEALATAMRCERGSSHSPLVQVGFSYQDELGRGLQLNGVSATELALTTGTSKFEMMLEIRRRGQDVCAEFEYSTDLFGPDRIEQMARHFARILAQLLEEPQSSVGGAWLLSHTERTRLAAFGTGPRMELACDGLRTAIENQLTKASARIALVSGRLELSYADLARQVDTLAARLRKLDPGPHRIVGLCTGRTEGWAIGVLAAMRLGWGYLPIDPELPVVRATTLLAQCESQVLLYSQPACAWANTFPGDALEIDMTVALDAEQGRMPGRFADNDTMYAISTSGSTGEPKIAAVAYGGFANLVEWYKHALALDAESRVLVVTSTAFDIAQKNLFAALSVGGQVVLYPDQLFDPLSLAALIAETSVTVINATPSLMNSLLDACTTTGYAALASLRHVVLGGEPVDARSLDPWLRHARGQGVTIWNTYGPSECSDVVSFWAGQSVEGVHVPIGTPIPNVELHVLDEQGNPVPIGVSGELCITGLALGKGYIGNPRATDEAFVRLVDGRTVYRTGDIVRYQEDGALQYEARRDQQVKVRGYRIELEEIESVLRQHPDVVEVAAVARRFRDGTAGIHVYFTGAPHVSEAQLALWARRALPRYMVPAMVLRVVSIPKTQSGKIDRKALPVLAQLRATPREVGEGSLEWTMLQIWEEALEISGIAVSDDFFDVGGHSLLAVKVAQRIGEAFGIACSVRDLVENPTVEQIVELLRARGRAIQRGA
jgi:amino acid adenylation domain-containing protein